jgi:hypothetical protein
MAYLEALRNGQDDFSVDTLNSWYYEMIRLGWTDDVFRRAVISVSRAKIFGKITFDCFLNSEDLYTTEEVNVKVNQILANRKRQYENMGYSDEELAKEGLINIQFLYDQKRIKMLETIEKRIGHKVKRIEYFIRNCDEKTKEEILQIAINKKVIVKDQFWGMVLPMCAPYLIDEIEPMLNRK